ncbi:hypothetical protein [Paraburkholderia podalyriae]|uniref:hypothetical protein n=1 Tax=Paraburkholderia podalyriae TaxID=1938811 RepID=UPI00165641BC
MTHGLPVAPNLLDQAFAVTVPNQPGCGDIRYIAAKPSKPPQIHAAKTLLKYAIF